MKLFSDKKRRPVLTHPGSCGGIVTRYYELDLEHLIKLSTLISSQKFRCFFPVMSDLIRGETGDVKHHNIPCTDSCCTPCSTFGVRGWNPSRDTTVDIMVHDAAFAGLEEQSAKTCGAASVASALNTVLSHHPAVGAAAPNHGEPSFAVDGAAPPRRVTEADVIDYYVQWASATSRAACCAALRGSCGLAPSTRNIGNHRLTHACHAVAAEACRLRPDLAAAPTDPPFGGSFGRRAAAANEGGDCRASRRPAWDEWPWDAAPLPSPVRVERLLGGPAFRDSHRPGGSGAEETAAVAAQAGPAAEAEAEAGEWALLCRAVAAGGAVLVHSRNHYACVFALRSWVCAASGATRRQVRRSIPPAAQQCARLARDDSPMI